jgi:hypothetical protein
MRRAHAVALLIENSAHQDPERSSEVSMKPKWAGDAGTDRLNLMRCSGGTRGVFGVLAVLRLKRLA